MKPFDMRPKYFVMILSMFAIFSTLMNGSNAQDATNLIISETASFFEAMQRIVQPNTQDQENYDRQFITSRQPRGVLGYMFGGEISTPFQKAAHRVKQRYQGPHPTPPYSDRVVRQGMSGSAASVMKTQITGRRESHFKDFEVIRQCAEEVYFEIEPLIPNTLWHRKALFYSFWFYKNILLNNNKMGISANHVVLFDYFSNKFKDVQFWVSPLCLLQKGILQPGVNVEGNPTSLTEKIKECCFKTFTNKEVTRWMNVLDAMVNDPQTQITRKDALKIFDAMLVLEQNLQHFGMLAFYPPNIGEGTKKVLINIINKFKVLQSYQPIHKSLTDY